MSDKPKKDLNESNDTASPQSASSSDAGLENSSEQPSKNEAQAEQAAGLPPATESAKAAKQPEGQAEVKAPKSAQSAKQTPELTPEPTQEPQKEPKPRRTGGILLFLFIILGWGATAAAGYWFWQQTTEQHRQLQAAVVGVEESVANTTQQKLSRVDQNLSQFRSTVSGELKSIEREALDDLRGLTAQLKEHEARLNGQQERLASLSTTTQEDWLLAEAQYLLKLANQRVLMERTPDSAVALLTRADEIIERVAAGLGDRELFAIRKQLASETTALKLIETIDVQGIYLKLGSLAEAINSLPTVPTEQERFTAPAPKDAKENSGVLGEIKTEFSNLIQFFKESFSIRAEDELANPIVTQQRLQLMQLNTRLLIEQAQIALLKEDEVAYSESLKAASRLVGQYYFESPQRAAFAQELSELAAKNVAMTLPDISQSLTLLHRYVAQKHRLGESAQAGLNAQPVGE